MRIPAIARTAAINAALQGLTLVSKATMMIGLARYLSVADLGLFGLFFATLNFAMFAVGLDFNAFSAREILAGPASRIPTFLRSQLALHGVSYGIAIPLLLVALFVVLDVLPAWLAGWFCGLLVLEHLGIEMQRLLVTLQRSSHATALQFIRQGAWGIAVPALMVFDETSRELPTLLQGWTLCEAIGLALGVIYLRGELFSGVRTVDWAWVRTGIRRAMPFFAATLALTAMRTVDRYAVKHYWDDEAVGVLTFFMFIRGAIAALIDTGIIIVLQPRIVAAHQSGRIDEYRKLMRLLFAGVLGAACAACAVALVLIDPVLALIGRPEYAGQHGVFASVLVLTVVAAVSDVPHTALYARHFDRAIITCAVVGLIATLLANLLLVPTFAVSGAVAGSTIGYAAMGLWGVWVLRRARTG
jgi:O-antigen/teichoic acid export membrane protein